MIKNYAEVLVERTLENLLRNNPEYVDICKCEECIDDIKAKALNNIKPHYVTGKVGEIYGEYNMLDYQNSTNIVMEVAKAIVHIDANRKHKS